MKSDADSSIFSEALIASLSSDADGKFTFEFCWVEREFSLRNRDCVEIQCVVVCMCVANCVVGYRRPLPGFGDMCVHVCGELRKRLPANPTVL